LFQKNLISAKNATYCEGQRKLKEDFGDLRHGPNKAKFALVVVGILVLALTVTQMVMANDVYIQLSVSQGPVRTAVGIYGMGFASGRVSILFDSKEIAAGNTGMFGRVNSGFAVPDVPPGTYIVSATDSLGNRATTTFTVTLKSSTTALSSAAVSLSPTQGPPGTTVKITGSGFTVGGSASINFGTTYISGPTADGSGGISATFNIPTMSPGIYTVSISGTGGKYASATFTVTQIGSTPGIGSSSTANPTAKKASFWSAQVIAVIIAIAAIAIVTPIMLIYRRRGKQEMLVEEEYQPYKPQPSPTPIKKTNPASKYDQFPTTRYSQAASYSPTLTKKPALTPARNQLGGSVRQQFNTKICPHCRQTIRDDYNVCPVCRKKLR
jgi:hypothetical protein